MQVAEEREAELQELEKMSEALEGVSLLASFTHNHTYCWLAEMMRTEVTHCSGNVFDSQLESLIMCGFDTFCCCNIECWFFFFAAELEQEIKDLTRTKEKLEEYVWVACSSPQLRR